MDRVDRAEAFLLSAIRGGLAHSYDVKNKKWVKPYPEVTGYLLSYFSENSSSVPHAVVSAGKRLSLLQHKIGGFLSFVGKKYLFAFDTAQIMHGFASLYKTTHKKEYLDTARRCAGFVLSMQLANGAIFPVYDIKHDSKFVSKKDGWGMGFSPIQVKNIEGLLLMHELTGEALYQEAAGRLRNFGKEYYDLTYTHPGAYCMEGLLAMGEIAFVEKLLQEQVVPRIRKNGFIPYAESLSYAYVSGSVQMGLLLFKVGMKDKAYSILEWARKVQDSHASGGLFQYANEDGSLNQDIHSEINTWGTKYYAQLERLF